MRISIMLSITLLVCQSSFALKLRSPEDICRQRGLEEGSDAWQMCITEAQADNDRITREFYAQLPQEETPAQVDEQQESPTSVYGLDTGFVPPFMKQGFSRRIQNQRQ